MYSCKLLPELNNDCIKKLDATGVTGLSLRNLDSVDFPWPLPPRNMSLREQLLLSKSNQFRQYSDKEKHTCLYREDLKIQLCP